MYIAYTSYITYIKYITYIAYIEYISYITHIIYVTCVTYINALRNAYYKGLVLTRQTDRQTNRGAVHSCCCSDRGPPPPPPRPVRSVMVSRAAAWAASSARAPRR